MEELLQGAVSGVGLLESEDCKILFLVSLLLFQYKGDNRVGSSPSVNDCSGGVSLIPFLGWAGGISLLFPEAGARKTPITGTQDRHGKELVKHPN